ncbi:MAG TPA: hypothetical protein VJC03_05205, partial [bacterium]|nr:hypothetical protein [bacterium]
LKAEPTSGSETVLLVKNGSLLTLKGTTTDSSGEEWYRVLTVTEGTSGYLPASSLEPVGDEKKGSLFLGKENAENEDKKRRIASIKIHTDWPARIKKAVRNGAICLKMTEEQLEAAWEKPYERTQGFILGNGDVKILFYRKENPIAVVVKNREVIGWSEKE